LHFHGTPITPRAKLLELVGRNFCVSFARDENLAVCHEIGQSVMLDNGAYSVWKRGATLDLAVYSEWVRPWLDYRTTWCVIPDRIDGSEEENDDLLAAWADYGLPRGQCAPVWHLHERISRLKRLSRGYPKVCLGSSGQYATVGDERWHRRMTDAMDQLCGDGPPPCWLHMLRGLGLAGSHYPFASADSTNIGTNHAGNHTENRRIRSTRAMADEVDGLQCAPRWRRTQEQLSLV
jgi:hypothetical protein